MQIIDRDGALILTSAIPFSLKRKMLYRGMAFGILGLFFLLPGIFLSPNQLFPLGLPSFLISLFFITYGLLPYRQLVEIEKNPYKLRVVGDKEIQFISKKNVFTLNFQNIVNINFKERERVFGIEIRTHKKSFFFPYFTKKSFEAFLEYKTQVECN